MKKPTNSKDKRLQIKLQLKSNWGASSRSVGRALGCHHSTVESVRTEMIESGYLATVYNQQKDENWKNHPYLKLDENRGLLEKLNPRGLRALKRMDAHGNYDVLDYMMANKTIKSPCVAQAKLAKEAIIRRKTAHYELTEDDIDIRVADVTKLSQFDHIANGSISLMIADPPFGRTSAAVCRGIAQVANAKLKDGGSLLVISGSSHLPEVIAALSSIDGTADKTGLRYHWLLACPLPQGASTSVSWLKVQSKVRIVLWYTKGTYTGNIVSDFVDRPMLGNPASKEFHHWGAPQELVSELIMRYSDPGTCVMDATLGGGSSAVAAVRLGRRFYGSDKNREAVEITRKRVRELFGYTR